MSSEAQNLIADVVSRHHSVDSRAGEEGLCSCGWQQGAYRGEWQNQSQHVAEEVDKALGELTLRWGVVIEHPPRPADGFPGTVVEMDSYKLRESAEITKRDKWPDDCYEVRSRWESGWLPEVDA